MDITSNKQDDAIKAGYKQTEVGIIPEDWECLSLGAISSLIGDGIHSTPVYSSSGTYFFINGNNFVNSSIVITENTKRVDEDEYQKHKKQLNDRTIFLSINGTIGNIAFYSKEKIILGKSAAYLNIKRECSRNYIYYSLQTAATNNFFRDGLTGSTIKNLGLGTIRNTSIALPKTKTEQTAIAKVLSDTDALIQSLSQLIAKKHQIKQGIMQHLLNPYDKRGMLKVGWLKKTLGNILKIGHGKSQHEVVSSNGQYPILASGGEIGRATSFLYDKPSVLIGRKGTIDIPQYMDRPFWTIDTLFYSEIQEPNNAKYIFYQFCLIDWYSYNEASGVPSLSARTIENIEITIPAPVEQTKIAKTLTDIDTEITKLENKRTKYQQIKQGMMQNLLTGRIRLL